MLRYHKNKNKNKKNNNNFNQKNEIKIYKQLLKRNYLKTSRIRSFNSYIF